MAPRLRRFLRLSGLRFVIEHHPLETRTTLDPAVPREEQFEVIAAMRKEGLIRHAGLSEVGVEEIKAAQKYFPVATVQNRYNFAARGSEDVLKYCEAHGTTIGETLTTTSSGTCAATRRRR